MIYHYKNSSLLDERSPVATVGASVPPTPAAVGIKFNLTCLLEIENHQFDSPIVKGFNVPSRVLMATPKDSLDLALRAILRSIFWETHKISFVI